MLYVRFGKEVRRELHQENVIGHITILNRKTEGGRGNGEQEATEVADREVTIRRLAGIGEMKWRIFTKATVYG